MRGSEGRAPGQPTRAGDLGVVETAVAGGDLDGLRRVHEKNSRALAS